MIECRNTNRCTKFRVGNYCMTCKNNKKRNAKSDFYEQCSDFAFPDAPVKASYFDPLFLQYQCALCGMFTSKSEVRNGKIVCQFCGCEMDVDI